MKNIKTKIILSVAIFLSTVGIVSAASSSLYVSPTGTSQNVGEVSIVSVGVNSLGNKVCGAEGTLVFNNLSCQSITVAGGLIAQSSPTCANPYFLVGIPSCTTENKVLFTISTKAGIAGQSSISATGVDVIGEGKSIGNSLVNGTYTIKAVVVPVPVAPVVVPKIISNAGQSDGFVGYVNGQIQAFPTLEAAQKAGATGIEPNYKRYPTAQVVKVATTTGDMASSTQVVIPATTTGDVILSTTSSTTTDTVPKTGNTAYIVIGIIVLALIGCGAFLYTIKRKV
jgi:LPXTG-motif cell wall-anchored protein